VTRRLGISGSAGLTSGDLLVEGRLPGTTSGSWWATARGTYYKYVAKRFGDIELPGFADAQFKVAVRPSTHTRLSVLGLFGRETEHRAFIGEPYPDFLEGNVLREQVIHNRLAVANLWWTPSQRLSTTTTLTGYSKRPGTRITRSSFRKARSIGGLATMTSGSASGSRGPGTHGTRSTQAWRRTGWTAAGR